MIVNIPNRQEATLLTGLDAVENIYKQRGYNISTMYMDSDFEPLNNKLKDRSINLNTTAQEKHVPEIERQIRVIKKRACSTWNTLPFAHMPNVMICS